MKAYFYKIFTYNVWANKKLIQNIRDQKIESERVLRYLSHIVLSEHIWMLRIESATFSASINFWNSLSLIDCEDLCNKNNIIYLHYLKILKDDDFKRIINYKNSQGKEYSYLLQDILTHVSIHSAYHRGQIVKEMLKLKKEIALIDYITFLKGYKG